MLKSRQKPIVSLAIITLFIYAARGLTMPFISLYLVYVGLSGVQIGVVLSLSAIVRLILPPMLMMLADRLSRHRKFFYGLVVGNSIATLVLIVAATFHFLLILATVIRDSLDRTSFSLLSQLTITQLKQENGGVYGRIRAWGSFGWAITTLISGAIFSVGGYALLFISASILNLMILLFSHTMPQKTDSTTPSQIVDPAADYLQTNSDAFYLLMLVMFLFSMGTSATVTFSSIYFQQELGASTAMIGILASVAALAEIPSMMTFDRLMSHINIYYLLLIGISGIIGMWFGYTVLETATLLIPLMVIRGTFFTFREVSTTLLVSRISHQSNVATNQTISQVTIPALAALVSGPIMGWVFDTFGGSTLFRLVGLMGITAIILLLMIKNRVLSVAA